MIKKYEILKNGECFNIGNHTLYRIKALRSFGSVRKGDIGGFVESERNLSHDGNCWIFREAKVYGNAKVTDDATICDKARVSGNAIISDNVFIHQSVQVYGHANISNWAILKNRVQVYGNATINGDAVITDGASVCGYSTITDNAMVYGNTEIRDTAYIGDDAIVVNAVIEGNASIIGKALIGKTSDYILMSPMLRNETLLQHSSLSLTFYKSKHGILISGDTRSCYTYSEFMKLLHEKIYDKKLLRRYKKVVRFAKKMIK